MGKPKPPAPLGATGKSLWQDVVGKWDLRADELRVLLSACVAADMEAEFFKAWADLGRPYMSTGSMGQEVEHPLIGSIDKQAKSKAAHLWRLKLPDLEDTTSGGSQTTKARAAAHARWRRHQSGIGMGS